MILHNAVLHLLASPTHPAPHHPSKGFLLLYTASADAHGSHWPNPGRVFLLFHLFVFNPVLFFFFFKNRLVHTL